MTKKQIKNLLILILGIGFLLTTYLSNPTKNTQKVEIEEPKKQTSQSQQKVALEEVIDGDTIKVLINNQEFSVRMIGLDTPELHHPQKPVQCFAKEAKEHLGSLLENKQIILENDPHEGDVDKYGRLLRYVFLEDGTNINEKMIKEGYGFEYIYNEGYKFEELFNNAEKFAQDNQLGLWSVSTCNGKKD